MDQDKDIFYESVWNRWSDMVKYSPAPRWRRDVVVRLIRKYGGDRRALLDVGCGNGWLLRSLGEKFSYLELSGFDRSASVVNVNKEVFKEMTFECHNVEDLSAVKGRYEIITCTEVLEHVENPSLALKNIGELLTRRGILIITVPAGPIRSIDRSMGHLRHFHSIDELKIDGMDFLYSAWCGFPFFGLYKRLINVFPAASSKTFAEGRYGMGKRLMSDIIYVLFHLNLPVWGEQLVVVMGKQ